MSERRPLRDAAHQDNAGQAEVSISVQTSADIGHPLPLADALTGLLAHSDHMDTQLRLRLAAYREGYAAGEAAHADDFQRGFTEGVMALKHTHRDAYRLVEVERQRWGRGGRKHFADPRPGDYHGGARPLERPSQFWLAGPVVHYHECTDACRSYKPGWYTKPSSHGGAA